MQVVLRSSTSARPRVASPGALVSDSAMPSPTILVGASVSAFAAQGKASAANKQAIWQSALAKIIRRDFLEPSHRFVRLALTHLARRVDRAGGAAFDFGEDRVLWHIDAGKRKGISRGNRV